MPHIRMRGLPEAAVAELSKMLLEQLAGICKVNSQGFTLDWIPSIGYRNGCVDQSFTQVEMLWFPKDPETHHLVEKVIREAVKKAYPESQHIVVMFRQLEPETYYRDGQHF